MTHREESRNVMAVQKVKLPFHYIIRVSQPHLFKLICRCYPIRFFFHQIIHTYPAELIIHCGIKCIPPKPGLGVLPYFADQHCLRICSFNRFSKCPPEFPADLVCHIQAPSIYMVFFDPIGSNICKIKLYLTV